MKKVALVTGSTSGIGLAIAQKLAENNYNIILNGFGDKHEIEEIAKSISERHQVDVSYHPADLSDFHQIKAMIEYAIDKHNKIDVIVNNAGVQYVSNIANFPEEKWQQIININLSAAFYTTKYAISNMQQNGWGRIINIASTHGLVASENKSAYVAAKHGIIGLTKVAALENAGNGITVNAICPGWVLTPLVQKQIDKIAKEDNLNNQQATEKLLLEKQPSGKFTQTEDIADTILFLCSKAADNMTGSNIVLDGGWTAR